MGASCCIAARKKPVLDPNPLSLDLRCSPSWDLNDRRTHSNDIRNNPLFQRNPDSSMLDMTSYVHIHTDDSSGGRTPPVSLQSPKWKKSQIIGGVDGDLYVCDEEQGGRSSSALNMEKDLASSSAGSTSPNSECLVPAHSFTSSPYKSQRSSPYSPFPSGPVTSRKSKSSFGYRIYRQISDIRIMRSLRHHDPAKRRKSSMLPNVEHSTGGSCVGSPDQWSLHLFSEFASSQRDRLSFGSEKSNCGQQYWSVTPEKMHDCGICVKTLKERPPWSSSGTSSSIPVVAVLSCGHIYHAECLEKNTLDMEKHDPPCPVCTSGSKQGSSSSRKAGSKLRGKYSRAAVGDCDLDSSTDLEQQKCAEKEMKVARRSFNLKSTFTRHLDKFKSLVL